MIKTINTHCTFALEEVSFFVIKHAYLTITLIINPMHWRRVC